MPSCPEPSAVNASADPISFLQAIPERRMRRGVRPQWFLLPVAALGILSGCQSLRDLERFAIHHHAALNPALGLELRQSPKDFAFRSLFQQLNVADICRQLQGWMLAQIPDGGAGLDPPVPDGNTLRGSIVATEGYGRAHGLRPTASTLPRRPSTPGRSEQRSPWPPMPPARTTTERFCGNCAPALIWRASCFRPTHATR
ncbi:MAG: transposase family protein [Cyanobacteria bacterium K_Offshore_surface_m2_011]|nr:transposase family protein [Cyanobacteria bacterium K_Offshore_surface_m2_011]